MRIEIRSFEPGHLDPAAALLAARHRAHRLAHPALDPAYEQQAAARAEIERLIAADGAAGLVALQDGAVAGYLLGMRLDDATWGPNAWVDAAGHAARSPAAARELYAVAAAAWSDEGRTHHYVVVPASDTDLVGAWFGLGFGQQVVHAIREVPPASWQPTVPAGLALRAPTRSDIPALAELDIALLAHLRRSPVFSLVAVPSLDAARAELEADFDDPRFTTFVAVREGRVVGAAVACSLEVSTLNRGLIRPASSGFLGYAAVLPEARGLGAGRALGEAVLAWSRDAGYPVVATDWRATNIEADAAWVVLGFRPTFLRLHRAIA